MNVQMWVAVTVGVMAILTGVFGFMRFMIKAIMNEIGPQANGTSLKGQVNRLERQMERMESRLDAVLLQQ
jgi:hypothetical protein